MTTPIPNCPQPETPLRERAWTDGQRLARVRDMLTANAALVEAMKLPDGYEVVEHLPGIWGYEYDRDDGERMASSASWNHPALAAIGAWRDHVEALAESAEPAEQGEAVSGVDLHDRIEFALRDAGFGLDEASILAERATAQPAQLVDIEAIRKMIAHLRSFRSNTPPTWAHLDDAADKLEAALQEKSP